MPGEPIASIPVEITGDFSDLDTALQQSVSAAQDGGSKIAAAFNSSAGSIDQWTTALENSTTASHDEVNALGQAADAFSKYNNSIENALGPESDFLDQLQQIPKSLTEMSQRSQDVIQRLNEQTQAEAAAAGGAESASNAAQAFSSSLSGVSSSAGGVLTSLLQFAGIQLTIQGIATAAKDALTAFADLQRATESMTALLGSAKLAETEIGNLRALAQDDAIAFPSLLSAAQRMTAFGLSTTQTNALLEDAANASRATGNSFDTTAQSIGRMVESGMAGARQLTQLGLTSKDLADVMGVTTGEVSKLFKALDESARFDIINAAMQKFGGLAKQTAGDTAGVWQQLSNTAQAEFQRVGKELADLGPAFSGFATGAIHALGGVADFFINFVTTIMSKGGDLANYLKNQAAGWGITFEDYGKGAQSAADSNKRYEQSIGTLDISARQLFQGFPDYLAKLKGYDDQLNNGIITDTSFKASVTGLIGEFKALHPEVGTATTTTKSYTDQVAALKQQVADGDITQTTYNTKLHDLEKQFGATANATKDQDQAIKDIKASYEAMMPALDKSGTSMQTLLGYTTDIEGPTQTYIGTLKEQGQAFQSFIVQSTGAATGFDTATRVIIKGYNDQKQAAIDAANSFNQLAAGYSGSKIEEALLEAQLAKTKTAIDATGLSAEELGIHLNTVGGVIPVITGGLTKFQTIGEDDASAIGDLNTQIVKLNGNVGAFGPQVSTFAGSASDAAAGIKIFGDNVAAANDDVAALYADLPQVTTATNAGTDAYKGMTVQVGGLKTGLADLSATTDEYTVRLGKVTQAMKDAIAATNEWHSGVKAFTPDMLTFSSIIVQTGDDATTAADKGITALNSWDKALKQLSDDWSSFQNSFATGLNNLQAPGTGTGKKGGAGTTSSQGDPNTSFNTITGTGFTLPPHTHLDYSLWGIMGARVVPDPGYVVDAFGNIVPDPFLASGPQFGAGSVNIGQTATTTAAGSTSTVAATVAAATTAVATLAPEVQALVNMGADLSQIGDLSLNVATLNTSITNLTTSVNTSSSTVASFSPVVQQATTQIAQAVQAQTAGFQRLTSIFAPPASATAANPGTPGSFMITTPNAPTSGPVTYNLNLNGQAQPNASSVLTDVVALLQRRGIRF